MPTPLSPNDAVRRFVMMKEIEAVLRRFIPPVPPQVDAMFRHSTDYTTYVEAVADAVVAQVDASCFLGAEGPISARLYHARGAYMVEKVGAAVVSHVRSQEAAGEDPTMVVAGFKAWAQRHALECGFRLEDGDLDAMVADLIPEAILKDVRPARAGGKGRRNVQGQVKG